MSRYPRMIQRDNVAQPEIVSRHKVLPVGAVFDIWSVFGPYVKLRVRITERKCRGSIYSFETVTDDTECTHWFEYR